MADYRCEECSKSFDSEKALNMHNQQVHGGSRGPRRGTDSSIIKETGSKGRSRGPGSKDSPSAEGANPDNAGRELSGRELEPDVDIGDSSNAAASEA